MATNAEVNAGYDALEQDIELVVQQFVPLFFQSRALTEIHSQRGRELILDGVRKVLAAAEQVRAKQNAA